MESHKLLFAILLLHFLHRGCSLETNLFNYHNQSRLLINFPVSVIGSPHETAVNDLSCDNLTPLSAGNTLSFDGLIPFTEEPMRSGYLCTLTQHTINCTSGLIYLEFSQGAFPLRPDREICKEAISLQVLGKTSSYYFPVPSCTSLQTRTLEREHLSIQRLLLPFNTDRNGIESPLFVNGLCQDRHCTSVDGRSHWFFDQSSEVGCSNLKSEKIQIQFNRDSQLVYSLIRSDHISERPLSEFCTGVMYCGRQFIRSNDYQGIAPLNWMDANWLDLVKQLSPCQTEQYIQTVQMSSFKPYPSLEDDHVTRFHRCSQVLTLLRSGHEVSSTQLAGLTSIDEGIFPAFRIESSTLMKYSMVYKKISGYTFETSLKQSTLKLKTSSGAWVALDERNCRYPTNSGPSDVRNCIWFNGIVIEDSRVEVPHEHNLFSIETSPAFLSTVILNSPDSTPPVNVKLDSGSEQMNKYLHLSGIATFGGLLLGLICLLVKRCLNRRSAQQDEVFSRHLPMRD